jgi:hypothetical protein
LTQENRRIARKADTPCFISTISFKRDENASGKTQFSEHQDAPKDHIKKTYARVLAGILPGNHPRSPSADADWWLEILGEKWIDTASTFPGVEIRKGRHITPSSPLFLSARFTDHPE